MGQIVTGFSMSLDGFVAGPNDSRQNPLGDGGEALFAWYGAGDKEFVFPSGTFSVKISEASAERLRNIINRAGVLIAGRRTFDITDGWGGRHTLGVPTVVLTHSIPNEWVRRYEGHDTAMSFVTEGFDAAIELARKIAGDKDIVAGTPSIAQQCLKAGLLDEVSVDLVPLLLGGGVRLFDRLGDKPIALERVSVVQAPGVTHLGFRVLK